MRSRIRPVAPPWMCVGLLLGSIWQGRPAKAEPVSFCDHDDHQALVPYEAAAAPSARLAPQQAVIEPAPIRIVWDTSALQGSGLDEAQRTSVIAAAQSVSSFFERILRVLPATAPLSFGDGCPGSGVSVNVQAVSADLVVALSALPVSSSTTLAWAVACKGDPSSNRPVLGLINFNPTNTPQSQTKALEDLIAHELMHVLGFSRAFMERFFRDGLGGPPRPEGSVLQAATINGQPATIVVSPAVRATARTHFGCPDLEGAELEDDGGAGTAGSHWELRVLQHELMQPVSVSPIVRSEFTLALLQDSGWYLVDGSAAEPLVFGRGQGCAFPRGPCPAFGPRFFCDGSNLGCDHTGRARSFCNIGTYESPLPAAFQYFANPNLGGSEFAEFCPRWQAFQNGDCRDTANGPGSAALGEAFGDTSGCFPSTLVVAPNAPLSAIRPNCHSMRCTAAGTLEVTVGPTTVVCPRGGGPLSVPGFNGSLICPAFSDRCATCGDGAITLDEGCDDGNARDGDGCSARCAVEAGFSCTGVPSACAGPHVVASVPALPLGYLPGLFGVLCACGFLFLERRRSAGSCAFTHPQVQPRGGVRDGP